METKDSYLRKMKAKFDDLNYKWNTDLESVLLKELISIRMDSRLCGTTSDTVDAVKLEIP